MKPDPYKSYMREFARDLRQIAVWKPGAATELGDYGELQNQQWVRLGSIWELLPHADTAELKKKTPSVGTQTSIRIGSAALSKAQIGAETSGAHGKERMGLSFSDTHSVFFSASNCETRSFDNLDAIARSLWKLAPEKKWKKQYRFVSEVSTAESFVVIIGGQAGSQVTVSAESSELLSKFVGGSIKGNAGIDLTGDAALQIVGESGPYGMTLVGIKAPWWKFDEPAAYITHGADGGEVVDEISPDPWTSDQFLKEFEGGIDS